MLKRANWRNGPFVVDPKRRVGGEMSAVLTRHDLVTAAGLLVIGALMSACSSSTPSPTASRAPALPSPVAPGGSALWGDLKPVVSVKELMRDILHPAYDYIF